MLKDEAPWDREEGLLRSLAQCTACRPLVFNEGVCVAEEVSLTGGSLVGSRKFPGAFIPVGVNVAVLHVDKTEGDWDSLLGNRWGAILVGDFIIKYFCTRIKLSSNIDLHCGICQIEDLEVCTCIIK